MSTFSRAWSRRGRPREGQRVRGILSNEIFEIGLLQLQNRAVKLAWKERREDSRKDAKSEKRCKSERVQGNSSQNRDSDKQRVNNKKLRKIEKKKEAGDQRKETEGTIRTAEFFGEFFLECLQANCC